MNEMQCPSCGQRITIEKKRNTGLYWGIGCLVAAIVLPVIIGIIGMLAAIAIPAFVKARETAQLNACVNNMRIIDAGKEQAAVEHGHRDGEAIPESEISDFVRDGLGAVVCPAGGGYTINPLGQDPECSRHGPLSEPRPGR